MDRRTVLVIGDGAPALAKADEISAAEPQTHVCILGDVGDDPRRIARCIGVHVAIYADDVIEVGLGADPLPRMIRSVV